MDRPNVTLVQKISGALVGIPSVLVLLGVDLSSQQDGALDKLIVLGIALLGGDAVIRAGRNVGDGLAARGPVNVGTGSDAAFPKDELPE